MPALLSLFPIPLAHHKQFLTVETCRDLRAAIVEQPVHENSSDNALSHTITTAADGFFGPETSYSLVEAVTDLGSLLFGQRLEWQIKEAWANVLRQGGEQRMHVHANSFISGVVYLTDSHPSANLVLHRPSSGRDFVFSNHNPESELNVFNAPRQQIESILAGDLILFPSYLQHSVPKNRGNTRTSVAFNAVPNALRTWDYEIRFGQSRR